MKQRPGMSVRLSFVVVGGAVWVAYLTAARIPALETWLLHGSGQVVFWLGLLGIWMARPVEALVRGGVHGWTHAVIGACAWGVACHWLLDVGLADRADDRYVLLLASLATVGALRLVLSPWLIRRSVRRALKSDPRLGRWLGAWQVYVGEGPRDPFVPLGRTRMAACPSLVRLLGALDRTLMGRVPVLPAMVRQEVAAAADRCVATQAVAERESRSSIEGASSTAVMAEVAGRFLADCEAGMYAAEPARIQMLRMERIGFEAIRFLLDVEDDEVVKAVCNAVIEVARQADPEPANDIYQRIHEADSASRLFSQLIRETSPELNEPGVWRGVLAWQLYREGSVALAIWMLEAGDRSEDPRADSARHALTGALLARRARDDMGAGDSDRILWLARGAMNVATAEAR
jgi:hypothetical protein